MKRAISFILVLVMCLSLIPMTALAYGNEWIHLENSNFDPNETIHFDYSGYRSQIKEDDFVYLTIFKKLATGDYEEGERRSLTSDETTNWLLAPAENGDYQLRLTSNDVLISTIPFTVGKVAKDGMISIDKATYTALAPIIVSVSGITDQMVMAKAFLSIYEKGATHDNQSVKLYVKAGSGAETLFAPNKNGEFEVRLYNMEGLFSDESFVMSAPFVVSGATGSGWAQPDLEKANQFGLIPDSLKGQDLSKPITRAEFAAVSVRVYENLTETKTTPSAAATFTDTQDADVLKAHNTGLMVGVSATEFEPNTLLNREQAATALTRVLKRAYIPGWTFATDAQFTLNFSRPAAFADDAQISDWAKENVYFMAANNIIKGMGDNKFAPKAVTTAEQAAGYATATREQAIIMGMRLVENLKDKPLNFQ